MRADGGWPSRSSRTSSIQTEARKRFIREGRLAASINHPNSVYVFGTEEIDGTPTISMEIVPGGTLQEKVVQDGPMPVPKAVDAIQQVIGGLDAARSIGILHRDVKPSNCFIDDQGETKIGDFGLSISTDARGDSHLTLQGSLLGTPAFSSPEQLRGDELNARSDMYSVGATLFYLLTGHAPFEEGNMVKLLSRVLEENAPDPRTHRSEIPAGLARIILRCLAKTPADRFKSYEELENALRPYGSEAPNPATLALRLGAYAIDAVLVGGINMILQVWAWGGFGAMLNQANMITPRSMMIIAGTNLFTILYFAILEGTWGATIGKKLVRLRLVRLDRSVPGFPRASLRAAFLVLLLGSPYWLMNVVLHDWTTSHSPNLTSSVMGAFSLVLIAILFCLARRENGYAGLHGLISGTRVVRTPARQHRPRLVIGTPDSGDAGEGAERIGPYHVIEVMGESDRGRWVLAYDTKLLRRVWLHVVSPSTPPVTRIQRELNRPGRLRWITGRRSGEENWDAFEAPAGKPLLALLDEGTPWSTVRFWLLDLANEFAASQRRGNHTPDTRS